ncbi:uncharacterized protein DUF1653 [Lachnotalea glycerini]|uniref:DUF1653 domain-containing protein n=1 Tax=Lachnotalea glycerini TaxID=1763509 RepID=A0A255ICV2_9FIRM|nr:DUF1653 domain-containing protein [Lachnotalea glycerini]PXV95752.1 uncharacterized protein DUF1653 [Lachnotalea glycerini]RDY33182.1 DUF1653 domain-containing protein [Lachnotalea glycerini]
MNNFEREVKQGEFYKHFKNKVYQIIAIATHSETREKMVVYQALYGDFQFYVRPYHMFISEVDHAKYPEVKQKYRFEKYDVNVGSIIKEENTRVFMQSTDYVSEKPILVQSPNENNDVLKEGEVSPLLLEFLDCKTYEEKLDKFVTLKNKADDRMLSDIAMSLDITVESEKLQDKYEEIKTCLLTFVHFEDNRMR